MCGDIKISSCKNHPSHFGTSWNNKNKVEIVVKLHQCAYKAGI